MPYRKVSEFGNPLGKQVHIILGRPKTHYIDNGNACMIEAWDIDQAMEIFMTHNPLKKKKKRRKMSP